MRERFFYIRESSLVQHLSVRQMRFCSVSGKNQSPILHLNILKVRFYDIREAPGAHTVIHFPGMDTKIPPHSGIFVVSVIFFLEYRKRTSPL